MYASQNDLQKFSALFDSRILSFTEQVQREQCETYFREDQTKDLFSIDKKKLRTR